MTEGKSLHLFLALRLPTETCGEKDTHLLDWSLRPRQNTGVGVGWGEERRQGGGARWAQGLAPPPGAQKSQTSSLQRAHRVCSLLSLVFFIELPLESLGPLPCPKIRLLGGERALSAGLPWPQAPCYTPTALPHTRQAGWAMGKAPQAPGVGHFFTKAYYFEKDKAKLIHVYKS